MSLNQCTIMNVLFVRSYIELKSREFLGSSLFLHLDHQCTILRFDRPISRSYIYSADRTVTHVIRDNSMPSWTAKSLRRIPKLINCVIRGHWIGISFREKNFTLVSFRTPSDWSIINSEENLSPRNSFERRSANEMSRKPALEHHDSIFYQLRYFLFSFWKK